MENTIEAIKAEIRSAVILHKPLNSIHEAYAVILEEVDEFWEEVKVNPKKLTAESQVKRVNHMRDELIQIAAMCVRTISDCGLELNY